MKIYELDEYKEDIAYIAGLDLPWEKLKNTSMLISGASGLIGSVLVDTVMYLNRKRGLNCRVLALGRNEVKAKERFGEFLNDPNFSFISADINKPLVLEELGCVEYVLHLASNTHPVAYATNPIGTVTTNIIGAMKSTAIRCGQDTRRASAAARLSARLISGRRGSMWSSRD